MTGSTAIDARLRVHFLGQPRFMHLGKPFAFTRPRTLGLLAFLLLNRTAHLTRDAVAFALWPDDTESDARTNLRRYLHLLTTGLPPSDVPYVVAKEDSLRWNDDAPVWFDVDVFDRTIDDVERSAVAVELYAGDLLPQVFDDWIFPIRDRLRRRYLDALTRLVVSARSARELPAAGSYAARILEHDPWREDAVRHSASIRFESGDRAGAVRFIDDFADRLREDMGVDPMPETMALRASILRGTALEDAAPIERPTRPAAGAFPFVGREGELERLTGAWKRAARLRGQLVIVGGEAGIGKTRLVSELALAVEAQGGRVLRGATPSPEYVPYQPIVEALREAVPFLATLQTRPVWLSALAALLPEIGVVRADLPPAPPLDAARERARLLESLVAVFNGLARQRPLLLVLEDLHWAGAATLDAIEYLARRAVAIPALIVVTSRPLAGTEGRELHALRRRLQAEGVIEHVALGGLPVEAVRSLAASVPGLEADADAVAADVYAVSDGNPLFAGELLRDRAEGASGRASFASLRDTIDMRASRLSESARRVAQVAGVVGGTFDVDLLATVMKSDETAVLSALDEMVERNLAREIGRSRFSFAFTHQLVADAFYATLDEPARKRGHAAVARAIERSMPDAPASLLAFHFDRAEEAAQAVPYYAQAARGAFALFANDEALAAANRGIELVANDRMRFELLALREAILARRGERDEQASALDELDAVAARLADATAAHEVLRRRAALANAQSRIVDEGLLLERVKAFADAQGDVALQAATLRAVTRNHLSATRYAEAEHSGLAALERYRSIGDDEGAIECLCSLAEIATHAGTAEAARERLREARERAAAAGRIPLLARVAMAGSLAAIMRREFADALREAEEALGHYRDIGDREGEAEATSRVASALGMLQRVDEGRAAFARSGEIYASLGNRLKHGYVLFNQTSAEIQVGLLDLADANLERALAIFTEVDHRFGFAMCRTNQSVIALVRGNAGAAKRFAEMALAGADEIGNHLIRAAALANLGNAERELGESDEALAHMREAIAIRERIGRPATFEELGDLALAQLAAADLAGARATAGDIVRRLPDSDENTVWPHACVWAAAQVFRACGEALAAADALARARSLVDEQFSAMTDPVSRAAFAALPTVREIEAAVTTSGWATAGST
jgi:DNA-binding SARP family transcriptional activator/tetratricopeptide (TPR) repeat protein